MSSPGLLKKLEYQGRALIRMALRAAFRLHPPGPPIDRLAVRSVCIMRIEEKIGDLLMTVPLMRSAKLTFPNARVTALVGAKQVRLIEGIAEVDEVIGFDKRRALRPWALPGIIARFRRNRYDLVIEASSWNALSINAVLLMKFALRYRLAIGHDTPLADRFFDYRPPLRQDVNEIRRTLGLLDVVEGAVFNEVVTLPPWPVPESVDRMIADAGLRANGFLLVHPGAYRAVRRWNYPAHRRFCELVEERFGLPSLIIYGAAEASEADAIRRELKPRPVIGPDLKLEEAVGLMRRARMVMTMNSGPMHLAVGSGSPTLAFAVGIDPYQWGYPAGRCLMLGSRETGLDPEDVFRRAEPWMAEMIGEKRKDDEQDKQD